MATEQQMSEVTDSDLNGSPQQALRRGSRLLRKLQLAARAARLESHVIELESALSRARDGDTRVLEQWLANYDQQLDDQQLDRSETDILASSRTWDVADRERSAPSLLSTASPPASIQAESIAEDGWSVYTAHARRRLDAIALQFGNAQPWLIDRIVEQPTIANSGNSPFTIADQAGALLDDELCGHVSRGDVTRDVTRGEGLFNEGLFDKGLFDEEHLKDGLPDELSEECLANLVGPPGINETHVTASQPLRKRVFGSYGLSILGHAIVLIVLGTMTYSAPSEGKSLGSQVLQSAESSDDLQLATEVELIEPAQLQMSEPMSEAVTTPSTAMASELAQLSQAPSATAVEIPSTSSVGATIADAISQAASKSPSGSRGSGTPSMNGNFFGVGTGGNYFCYVVDRSGSMRGGAWESAKAELVRSLKSLKATQKFYIIFFAAEFEALPEPGSDQPAATGLYATPDNIEHARRWIQSVQLSRGGPPNQALAWAIDRQPDAIYLLTDGVTKVDVCGFLRKNNHIEDIVSGPQVRVPIHAIAYFSLDGQQLMRQLAQENQGQFIYVPKPKTKK